MRLTIKRLDAKHGLVAKDITLKKSFNISSLQFTHLNHMRESPVLSENM